MEEDSADAGGKTAGGAILAASLLSILAMAHHPAGPGNLALAGPVHGVLMVLVVVLLAGYARFAASRGLNRFLVLAGLGFYGAGVAGNLLAAAINGFAVPALIERGSSEEIFAFAWALNQALAYAAVYAISTSFALWGVDMLRRGAPIGGVVAVAAGIAPAALLASGMLDMHVAGANTVYAIEAAFGIFIGLRMIRGVA